MYQYYLHLSYLTYNIHILNPNKEKSLIKIYYSASTIKMSPIVMATVKSQGMAGLTLQWLKALGAWEF